MTETVDSGRDTGASSAAARNVVAAFGRPSTRSDAFNWRLWIGLTVWVVLLFCVGFGVSKMSGALRSQPFLVAQTTSAQASLARASIPYGLSVADLETLPWREAAAKINSDQSERILADARDGDAYASTIACLGHMAGRQGFLPSPTAARTYCEAAAAQNYRPALYLSWALSRSAPHASGDDTAARAHLTEAARRGLAAAQVDYALLLAPDVRAAADAQVEAGRLLLAAAEQGDARGQFFYARWLRDSPAGPRDPAAAIPFLERAAGHNQNDATHMLATLYRDGVGVTRDRGRARALYEQAASRNFAPSMFNLADLLREDDPARAITLYRRLACMPDEREISAMAMRRLRALHQASACAR